MMIFLSWFILLFLAAAAVGLLLTQDWRWSIGFLAALYLGVFLLLQASWPVSVAAAKLVTGWMACTVLAITQANLGTSEAPETAWPQGRPFRLFAAGMTVVAALAVALGVTDWLGLTLPAAWGSLLLVGLGLIHLGVTTQPFRVVLGLLTALAGFELLYAAVEHSALVTALLAVVNLGLALAGAYFLSSTQEETA